MPVIFSDVRIFIASISAAIMNNNEDSGHPCFMPLFKAKEVDL